MPAATRLMRIMVITGVLLVLSACSDDPGHLRETGFVVRAPAPGSAFSEYLQDTRQQIQSALASVAFVGDSSPFGQYRLDDVVDMRSPYQLDSFDRCEDDQSSTGVLLIHGLSDSPYLLSRIAETLVARHDCLLLRAILLPGHGTGPGDSNIVDRHEWRQATRFGIESFRGEVDQLYLVGYSAGATLSVDYIDQQPNDELIAGMILLSPALGLPGSTIWLSPYLRWFTRWLGVEGEHDAAKYESFSIHAGAEFYLLIRSLNWPAMAGIQTPVMMIASGDDATVDIAAAGQFFCEKLPESSRQMIWYQSGSAPSTQPPQCAGVDLVAARHAGYRVQSLSHVGITMPPDDPHYGLDARYRQCLHYPRDSLNWQACRENDNDTVYGERHLIDAETGLVDNALLRRATFNPDFDTMMSRISEFLSRH